MSSFVKASEIEISNVKVDSKVEEEVEEYHKYVMNKYDMTELEAFLSIFQKYSLEFRMEKGLYYVKNKDFNDCIISMKKSFFNFIDFIRKNDNKGALIVLNKMLNNFDKLYEFKLSNSKCTVQDFEKGLYKMNYTLLYLKAYLERKVLI